MYRNYGGPIWGTAILSWSPISYDFTTNRTHPHLHLPRGSSTPAQGQVIHALAAVRSEGLLAQPRPRSKWDGLSGESCIVRVAGKKSNPPTPHRGVRRDCRC